MAENTQINAQQEPTAPIQQTNRFFIIAIILLAVFLVGLFFLGPSIGLYLPCHGGIQPIPNATAPTV